MTDVAVTRLLPLISSPAGACATGGEADAARGGAGGDAGPSSATLSALILPVPGIVMADSLSIDD
jgi:hypothetical protein